MPVRRSPWALVAALIGLLAMALVAGCAVPSPGKTGLYPYQQLTSRSPFEGSAALDTMRYRQLANDLGRLSSQAGLEVVSATPGSPSVPVVHLTLEDRVLFDPASDQPTEASAAALNVLVDEIRRQTPEARVTVVGHTDAIGSDAYNMALSRRRGLTIAHLLAERGFPPDRLGVVAIGKRQPIASNDTEEGRARNRRVEFLISPAQGANLQAIRTAPTDPAYAALEPLQVLPLLPPAGSAPDPAVLGGESSGLSAGPAPVARGPRRSVVPAAAAGSASPSIPQPAPHYDTKSLSPVAQPNTLGPALPY